MIGTSIENYNEFSEKSAVSEDETSAGESGKTSAVVYLDFSSNDKKSRKNAFRRKWMKKSAERKTADTSIGWDLARKNYWVAGAGILAILVLHLFFQISFVQNQAVQTVDKLPIINSQIEELTETLPMPETDYESKIEAKYKLPNADTEIKSKSAAPILKLKTAPTAIPLKRKDSPTAPRETRAERLRRVEKMLTGV